MTQTSNEDMSLNNSDNHHLGHSFKNCMLENLDALCQIDAATGEEETRRSVYSRSVILARCLRRLGLQPGDVLVIGGKNHLNLFIPYYAGLMNGHPVAGVDPSFKFEELKQLFNIIQPKIAFCQREFLSDYQRAVEALCLDTRVVTFDMGDGNTMADLIEDSDKIGAVEDFEIATFDLDKVYAWLVSTSGSTGPPKIAAVKHHQPILKLSKFIQIMKSKTIVSALNLALMHWMSAFLCAWTMPALNQIRVQTSAPPTAEHVIDIINKYRPVSTMITPALMQRILKHDKPCDLSCFNVVFFGGIKVSQSYLLNLKAALRPDALAMEAYGQTECLGMPLAPSPDGPLGNCGREMPLFTVKLVDPVTGRTIVEPDVPGELWIKEPGFTEYYRNPEETEKAFTKDGWYKSGDLLRKDENGYYYFVERLKMLIKFRSHNVAPLELEEVILKHDGVQEVCVTSIPNSVDRERPVAVVVRKPGATVTAQEIKDLVADTLVEHKQLSGGVLFVNELPMASTGKIARAKVQHLVENATLE